MIFETPTLTEAVEASGMNLSSWFHNCHAVSLALVRSGILPEGARVVRGTAYDVLSQHSWITLGHPYDYDAPLIDPTIWSYWEKDPFLWSGTLSEGIHRPHGFGFMKDWRTRPRPDSYDNIIQPDKGAYNELSGDAMMFLSMLGSLDVAGWCWLMRQGMQGWPSEEIIVMMKKTPRLSALVPIDLEGMLTDRNPSNVYF